jgi:uncharacterized repeat protein (TIGR01451 family)
MQTKFLPLLALLSFCLINDIFAQSPELDKAEAARLMQQSNGYNLRTSSICIDLTPICTQYGQSDTLMVGQNRGAAHTNNPSNYYGCLYTTPNPTWYYLQIDQAGLFSANISARYDVDYAVWGPFPSVVAAEAACGTYSQADMVSCGYNAAAAESFAIPNAQQDEVYVLLITNFGNMIQPVVFTPTNSMTSLNCQNVSQIYGYVYGDRNQDCITNAGDIPLPGMMVNCNNRYTYTDNYGFYDVLVDSGVYDVRTTIPVHLAPFMNQRCDTVQTATIDTMSIDTMLNFYNDILMCPYLTLGIGRTAARRCALGTSYLYYQNQGTTPAYNVQVFLNYPTNIQFVSASLPAFTNIIDTTGNSYYFNVGTVLPGGHGYIHIVDSVLCRDSIVGEIECIRGWITPPNSCLDSAIQSNISTTWDGSSIRVTGFCLQDTAAQFLIRNVGSGQGGGNMLDKREYRIYIDGYLSLTDSFQIGSNGGILITVPANGSTIRLEADQHPQHPGNSHPHAIVHNCGDTSRQTALDNWLAYNAQPQNDLDLAVSEHCMAVVDSYDPNDKQVVPCGVDSNRIVPPNTLLDYTIRFQNTGTISAIKVVIRDTLSPHLDISSLQLGAASHQYNLTILDTVNPVLIFEHNNIYLPDSASNPLGSQGFVTFKIGLRANTPLQTVIDNDAAIYFDFNAPIITNTAWVTLDELPSGAPITVQVDTFLPIEPPTDTLVIIDSTIVHTSTPNNLETPNFAIYPNPNNGKFTLDLTRNNAEAIVEIYSVDGHLQQVQQLTDQQFYQFDISHYPSGIYLIRVSNATQSQMLKLIKH